MLSSQCVVFFSSALADLADLHLRKGFKAIRGGLRVEEGVISECAGWDENCVYKL